MSPPRNRELAPRRWDRLRDVIRARQVVRVDELCRQLKVSPATIRRDLASLESLGEIRRVYGGAVSLQSNLEEPLFDDKTFIKAQEKRRIAQAALKFIEPGDTIYLDGGSTVLELARLLRDRNNVCVVTNSLRAALELAGAGPRLMLVGGELRRLSQTLVGPLTRSMLERHHFDKAFMGTIGLTLEQGLTTTDPGEAYTKELAMRRSRETILLVDSSKVGKVAFARAGGIEDVTVVITDGHIEASAARALRKAGIKVVRA
ncbi:MAG TPA: DeoR/GlpR transcriptional regulator [Candidatus Hydrogenedentes bacterium]|nr:DeoR/GlpR transcriptional regulator [Candidatus Hydrogenedentota bacterium]